MAGIASAGLIIKLRLKIWVEFAKIMEKSRDLGQGHVCSLLDSCKDSMRVNAQEFVRVGAEGIPIALLLHSGCNQIKHQASPSRD